MVKDGRGTFVIAPRLHELFNVMIALVKGKFARICDKRMRRNQGPIENTREGRCVNERRVLREEYSGEI